jgi:hypothetical protein
VLGDSLTKEYEATFVGLYPNNPAAWQARNWIEILHQHRTDWFDTGTWSVYSAPRLTGHRFNWAFPGATTSEIRTLLTNFINKATWVPTLENHIRNDVQRVVIFAGGNDADSYYANLYNGAATSAVTNTTLQNIQGAQSERHRAHRHRQRAARRLHAKGPAGLPHASRLHRARHRRDGHAEREPRRVGRHLQQPRLRARRV